MKVDFFRIVVPGEQSFVEMLESARTLPDDDESRVRTIDEVPFRLQTLTRHSGLWAGEMIRIRMNDVPIIVSLSGEVDEVELEEDEGFGEQSAFLYDPSTQVLVIQRNRFGVSAGKLARWFESVHGLEEPIMPDIVPRSDLAADLQRIRVVRNYRVRFAGIRNPQLLTAHEPNTPEAIRLLSGTVPVIDITVAMGRERGTLPVQATLDVVRRFFRWGTHSNGSAQVSSIQLEGTYDDDEPASLNLLDYRMREDVEVEFNAHRQMEYGDRIAGLREAFARNRATLEAMYPAGE